MCVHCSGQQFGHFYWQNVYVVMGISLKIEVLVWIEYRLWKNCGTSTIQTTNENWTLFFLLLFFIFLHSLRRYLSQNLNNSRSVIFSISCRPFYCLSCSFLFECVWVLNTVSHISYFLYNEKSCAFTAHRKHIHTTAHWHLHSIYDVQLCTCSFVVLRTICRFSSWNLRTICSQRLNVISMPKFKQIKKERW